MNNPIARQNLRAKRPPPMHPAAEAALSVGLAALEDKSLHCGIVPSGALVSLRSRRQDLEECLAPASQETVLLLLASLGGMPSQTVSNSAEAKAMLRQDADDLADLSAWALEEAVKAYRRGEIGDGKWRPTAGQIRKEALKRAAPVKSELWRVGKLLDAPSLTDPVPVYVEKEVGKQLLADMVTMLNSKAFPPGDDGDYSHD